jgi:tRNA threonylcarbamoyladenosine biosynthesis protein TsaB
MKNILEIDTSNSERISVKFIKDGKETTLESISKDKKSETLLLLIDKLLKKCHTDVKEISELKINNGPGSYTGLRVGISVANALSHLLNIDINGEKGPITPKYL